MISIDVKIIGEEVLVRLDKLPAKIREKIDEKFMPILEALKFKIVEAIGQKFEKQYPDMFIARVDRVGEGLAVGYVEFKPSDKSYLIRVGSKGVLANLDTGFFSKRDVLHPPMKPESVRAPFDAAYRDAHDTVIVGFEDAIFEAIYED